MSNIIGVDIDGVLADFPAAFNELLVKTTGKDLFPSPCPITCWNWFKEYGYTGAEAGQAWEALKADDTFWLRLKPYPWAEEFLWQLAGRSIRGDDIYFITSRPGKEAKHQTEWWLKKHHIYGTTSLHHTVLLSSEKGMCCEALGITHYIDDKPENLDQVLDRGCKTTCFLFDREWNQTYHRPNVKRITNPCDMLKGL